MASGLLTAFMMAILIAGCAKIFLVHKRRAARSGVLLRSSDVFTRFPSDPATEIERSFRVDAIKAVRMWFALWLVLAFLLGMFVTPFVKSSYVAPGPMGLAHATGISVGYPNVTG